MPYYCGHNSVKLIKQFEGSNIVALCQMNVSFVRYNEELEKRKMSESDESK